MTGIDPSKVKAGDTVWVRFIETGEELVTKAYRPESITEPGPWAFLLGWPLNKGNGGHGLAVKYFEILDHQPAPQPEWQPGTVYEITTRDDHTIAAWCITGARSGHVVFLDQDGEEYDPSELLAITPQTSVNFTVAELEAEVERLRAKTLPTDLTKCICPWDSEDRGGGHSEIVAEYEPACPVHSEHVYDPRAGEWIACAPAILQGTPLPTLEQVAELARMKFGGPVEAWLTFAEDIRALFEQGGAAPKVTQEELHDLAIHNGINDDRMARILADLRIEVADDPNIDRLTVERLTEALQYAGDTGQLRPSDVARVALGWLNGER